MFHYFFNHMAGSLAERIVSFAFLSFTSTMEVLVFEGLSVWFLAKLLHKL